MILNKFCSTFSLCGVSFAEVSITLFWLFSFLVENYWRLAIIMFDTKSILFNLFIVWYQLCRSINRSFLGIYFWWSIIEDKEHLFLVEYYWRFAIITFDIESIFCNLLFEASIIIFLARWWSWVCLETVCNNPRKVSITFALLLQND